MSNAEFDVQLLPECCYLYLETLLGISCGAWPSQWLICLDQHEENCLQTCLAKNLLLEVLSITKKTKDDKMQRDSSGYVFQGIEPQSVKIFRNV